jgi:hypothetical protein
MEKKTNERTKKGTRRCVESVTEHFEVTTRKIRNFGISYLTRDVVFDVGESA